MNRRAIRLLNGLIALKESILDRVLNCRMFTMNYPLLIEHILREAKLYRIYVNILEESGEIDLQSMKDSECFWNQIMMEHAMFIRGLLGPAETDLLNSANTFAEDYSLLLNGCPDVRKKTIIADSLTETIKFREFNIQQLKLPLLKLQSEV